MPNKKSTDRRPCRQKYTAEKRWETNKKRRLENRVKRLNKRSKKYNYKIVEGNIIAEKKEVEGSGDKIWQKEDGQKKL